MTVLYLLVFILISNGIYQLVKYSLTVSNVAIENKAIKCSALKSNKLIIIVPVLHEEKTIEQLLEDLLNQDYPCDCYEVIVVTTQREYLNSSVIPNTIDLLNDLILNKKFSELNLKVIHYPEILSYKSDQLNLAFNEVKARYGTILTSNCYFLILDSDARMKSNSLKTFNDSIETGFEFYQQVYLRFKNIYSLKNALMESASFLQSFYAISSEIPMYTGKYFPLRLRHFMGHGLLIKGSFLLRIKGFPGMLEDIRLGRLSSFLNEKVKLIPEFGIVENAKNLLVYLQQISVWFFGCTLFVQDFKHALTIRKNKSLTFIDSLLLIYGFFKCSRWLNEGLFHLIGLTLSINLNSVSLCSLFILSLLINSTIPAYFASRDLKKFWQEGGTKNENRKIMLRSILVSPMLYILNSIGLYYGLYNWFVFTWKNEILLPKTER